MIIGITGTIGAGKGTVVDYLVKNRGFTHFSVRDLLREEITKRGLPINRDTMTEVANDLRKTFGAGVIAERLLAKARERADNVVIESIRSPGEVSILSKEKDFVLWAVDADPEIRYERAVLRGSETDHVSYEKFLADEAREISSDPWKGNLRECISLAAHVFDNNGTPEELFSEIGKTFPEA